MDGSSQLKLQLHTAGWEGRQWGEMRAQRSLAASILRCAGGFCAGAGTWPRTATREPGIFCTGQTCQGRGGGFCLEPSPGSAGSTISLATSLTSAAAEAWKHLIPPTVQSSTTLSAHQRARAARSFAHR